MLRFGIIGVAGYIAPRHLKAIKDVGGELVVATDTNDSVGILDSYFPKAVFYRNFEEFAAFICDEQLAGRSLDFISICSPNFLHSPHIKFALRQGIDVICEKPLVLTLEELNDLADYERQFGGRVYSILQLRLHSAIIALRERLECYPVDLKHNVKLTYMTSRGGWYLQSWKGDEAKSGGLATNIGVHFFDMLSHVFGSLISIEVQHTDEQTVAGHLEYEKANVTWFLSIDETLLPENAVEGEKKTFRSIEIGGEELEFSAGFTELHTLSYERIVAGQGFGVEENRMALAIVQAIRQGAGEAKQITKPMHPLLEEILDSAGSRARPDDHR